MGNVSIDINLFKNSGYEFYREFFRVNKLEKIYINETLVLSLIIDEKIYKETTDRYISFRWGKIEYNANNQIYLYYKDIKQVLIDKNRLAIQEGNKNFLFVFKNNVIIPNMTPISDQERGKRYNEFRSFLDSYK